MNRHTVVTIASKDLGLLRRKRSVRVSILAFPLLVAVVLPLVIRIANGKARGGIPASALPGLLHAFTFVFVVGAAVLPTAIASYSLVGEKVEGCLEPLLATPATDSEILLGKSIAAFLPSVAAIYAGAVLFMALSDAFAYGTLGYLYFPNWTAAVIFVVMTPLAAILCIEFNILISARVSDIRAAQQLGALAVLPLAAIYLAGELNVLALDLPTLGIISGALVVVDGGLFVASRATFQREEILTRWK